MMKSASASPDTRPRKTSAAIVGPRRKRGRPRSPATVVVGLRMSADVYDAYCRCALRADQDVRAVLRHILALHAPRT